MARKPTVAEIQKQLQTWYNEVRDFRNDGWVQKGYREKIETLHADVNRLMNNLTEAETTEKSTPVSNRSLSNRYSGDPRNEDS
jgi:hypothetical protein